MASPTSTRKRGRPRKFPSPSVVVALTLPEDVVQGLRRLHPDLAWAIVTLFERRPPSPPQPPPDVELVNIASGQFLIVVNRKVLTKVPGVRIIPLSGDRAFLALESGRGIADLEVAVIDRLEQASVKGRERKALMEVRSQLRRLRRDRSLRFHSQAIIVVERVPPRAAVTAS